MKQCWGASGQEEEALQAAGTGRVLMEATGAESFPGRSEVVRDQAQQPRSCFPFQAAG